MAEHEQQEAWQKADARVLGQILAAQNIIFTLPGVTRIAEFYAQTLISIPGITACRVCLGGRSVQAGEMASSVCAQCEALHATAWEDNTFSPADSNFKCKLADQPEIQFITIDSFQHHFGFFVLKIKHAAGFEVYHPFIINLANYLAITLENHWQKELLQKAQADLERKVEERTHDLKVANADLQREITHRKRAEEALREQFSTLRSIIDSTNALIFSVDREYRYTSFNRSHTAAMQALYGAEIETGHSLLGYMTVAGDREKAQRNLDRALAGEQIVEESYSGDELWSRRYFQVAHSPIRTETGEIIGVAMLAQDITERRAMELALAVQEKEYRTLVEHSPDLIVRYDTDLRRTYVNPAWEKASGLSAEEVVNVPPADISKVPQVTVNEYMEKLREALTTRNPQSIEFSWVNAYGVTLYLDYVIVPEYDQYGEITSLLSVGHDLTERRQAEEGLRRRNRELQALSNCNQALLRAIDEQTLLNEICRIVCDEAGYRLAWVGYVEHDEAKTVWPVAWAGDDSGYIANARLSWAADSERGQGPAGNAIRSGEIIYVQDFATDPRMDPWREDALRRGYRSEIALPLKDENAQVFGVLLIYSTKVNIVTPDEIWLMEELAGDLAFGIITLRSGIRRKQVEEALRESEEQYRFLIQKVHTGIVLHDGQGRILASNPLAQHLLGLSDEQLLGKALVEPTWRFLREDGSAMPITEYPVSLVLSSRQPLRGYIAGIVHPDKLIWVLINAEPEFAARGKIVRVIVSFIDITEKKRAEESLRKLSRAVEQSPVSIIITDTTGAIEYVNPRFTELTGYTLEEVRGQNPRVLKSGETPSEEYRALWETILSGRAWQGEFCNKKKNGELYWEWTYISPVSDQAGVITNFVAAKENITERKQAEQELERYQEHLEELVTERTAELRTANEQLRVLSHAKDAFVSNVSHELRTPITNLKLREYLLKAHPDRLDDNIQVIERETERLSQIIENLLQLSRLDQERTTFTLAPINLNDVIGQYVLDRTLMAEEKNLTLAFHGDPGLPKVMADANLIGQVLSILLTNALNYTPAEGQVIVQTHPTADRQWVGFSVIDTGLGIVPNDLPKLFTRFFRGETGRTSGVPGTGLGLALAKEIVDRHSGRIEVKSEGIPGKGTTFTVWMPALDRP